MHSFKKTRIKSENESSTKKLNALVCQCISVSLSLLILLITAIGAFNPVVLADSFSETKETVDIDFSLTDYDLYLKTNCDVPASQNKILLTVNDASGDFQKIDNYEASGETIGKINYQESANWSVSVAETSYYEIKIRYYSLPAEFDGILQASILLDGKSPYNDLNQITFETVYVKKEPIIKKDILGNELRSSNDSVNGFFEKTLYDQNGYYEQPLKLVIPVGQHTISLQSECGVFCFSDLMLLPYTQADSYKSYLDKANKDGVKDSKSSSKRIEAESTKRVSSPSIIPLSDRSSPMTSPSNPNLTVYNTIGSDHWKTVGEWIEWEIDVPEDAFYQLETRFKQDLKRNSYSYRSLYIDGQIPFKEAGEIKFPYASGWQDQFVGGNDSPYKFYLSAGKHIIRMEVRLCQSADVLKELSKIITELNGVYLDIIVVTGVSPDTNRDYHFENIMPDMLAQLKSISKRLKGAEKYIKDNFGKGEGTAIIRQAYLQIDKMTAKPSEIPKRLNNYKENITSIASWTQSTYEQPLELDTLQFKSCNSKPEKAECSFIKKLLFRIKQMIYSYTCDYDSVGKIDNENSNTITVWMGSSNAAASTNNAGRDQAQIIQQLCYEFAQSQNISVSVQLVSGGALLPAMLSGRGPDVALGLTQGDPVNYALRNAVTDLSQMDGIDKVLAEFSPAFSKPFCLDGKIYALPESGTYPMLFVRTDIMEHLGISVSDLNSWEDIMQGVLPVLQNSYLQFGIPSDMSTYAMFLYQRGGKIYNDENTETLLNSMESVSAFSAFTELFTDYKQALSYDLTNRFRSGEMPIAIAPFSAFNQLAAFAPEINGKWIMIPVPGVLQTDGTVNRLAPVTVSGASLLSSSNNKEAAWKFLKWWVSADTQRKYANELESLLGSVGRYATANTEAFNSLSWNFETDKSLKKQREMLFAIPEIAGGYFTSRNFDFAFRDVVYNGYDVREALSSATMEINTEIKNKRKEFYR